MDFLITHPQEGQEVGLLATVMGHLKKQVGVGLGPAPPASHPHRVRSRLTCSPPGPCPVPAVPSLWRHGLREAAGPHRSRHL